MHEVDIHLLVRLHHLVHAEAQSHSQTYDAEQDTFRVIFLIGPSMLLAIMINHEFSVTEVLWTFSIYLEAVAILPQLVLLQRTKNVDTLTGNYVFLLGGYRALYLLNWIYRFLSNQATDSGSYGCLERSRLLCIATSSTIISSLGTT